MEWLEFGSRSIYTIGRFLVWLVWEMLICLITWWVGWPICRIICLGKFPDTGFWDYDGSDTHEAFLVCLVGSVALAGTFGWLANRLT